MLCVKKRWLLRQLATWADVLPRITGATVSAMITGAAVTARITGAAVSARITGAAVLASSTKSDISQLVHTVQYCWSSCLR